MRVLVRSPNWIGDQVMARPFYEGLRAAYPSAELTLLCAENVSGLDYPECFDAKLVLKSEDRRSPLALARFARRLRGEGFDLGISLPASVSSAFLLFAAGIPQRVGFAEDGAALFLNAARAWPGRLAGVHKARLYLDLLEWMTARRIADFPPPAPVPPSETERLIVLAPGASIPLRVWPYFRELLPALREKFPQFRLALVGGKTEREWHETLRAMPQHGVEDWVEKTDLAALTALCARARLVIANDSGVAHLAATLARAPTLVLYGPGDPNYIRPLGPRVQGLRVADLPCSPCERPRCRAPFGYQQCLRALPLEWVLGAVARLTLTEH